MIGTQQCPRGFPAIGREDPAGMLLATRPKGAGADPAGMAARTRGDLKPDWRISQVSKQFVRRLLFLQDL